MKRIIQLVLVIIFCSIVTSAIPDIPKGPVEISSDEMELNLELGKPIRVDYGKGTLSLSLEKQNSEFQKIKVGKQVVKFKTDEWTEMDSTALESLQIKILSKEEGQITILIKNVNKIILYKFQIILAILAIILLRVFYRHHYHLPKEHEKKLFEFISAAKAKDYKDEQIHEMLLKTGWKSHIIKHRLKKHRKINKI